MTARQTAEKIARYNTATECALAAEITAALEAKEWEIAILKASNARIADCSCTFGCARGEFEMKINTAKAQLDEAVRLLENGREVMRQP